MEKKTVREAPYSLFLFRSSLQRLIHWAVCHSLSRRHEIFWLYALNQMGNRRFWCCVLCLTSETGNSWTLCHDSNGKWKHWAVCRLSYWKEGIPLFAWRISDEEMNSIQMDYGIFCRVF